MENNRQYYYGKSSTLNIGGTLVSTGRYPIAPWGQWRTLSDLEDFITDVSASAAAFPGMVVSVVDDEENNGVYMIWKVGADALDENDNTKCSPDAYRRLVFKGEYGKLHLEDGEEPEDGITNVAELQEVIEGMDYTYALGLTDLDDRLNETDSIIANNEKIYAQIMTDLRDRINSVNSSTSELNDNDEILSAAITGLHDSMIENEKTTAKAINYLNDRIDLIVGGGTGGSSNIDYGQFPIPLINHLKSEGAASVDDAMDYIEYYFGSNKGSFGNLTDSESDNDVITAGWADVLDTRDYIRGVENNLISTITDNELLTATAFNDLNLRLVAIEPYVVKQDSNGSLKTSGATEDTNYIGATEDIVFGVGVYADKRRSFGWGSGFQGIWLTPVSGSDTQYTVEFDSLYSNVLEAFADACIGGHILASGTTHQRVAAIIDAVYDNSGANPILTITLDSTLTDNNGDAISSKTKYTYESKTGEMNFCAGSFMNSGRQNIALGTSQFVTGGMSVNMGVMNGSTSNYSVTIGSHNSNKSDCSNVIGGSNVVGGHSYSGAFGYKNTLTANGLRPNYAIGYSNTINSGNGVAVGGYNTISTDLGFAIGEYNTVLYPGVALGYYSKSYTSNSDAEKNLFVVGAGDIHNSKNTIEQKQNGDLYITGIGTFNGTNSGTSGVETLQAVIADLARRLAEVEAQLPTT